jgi:hypothetical protein
MKGHANPLRLPVVKRHTVAWSGWAGQLVAGAMPRARPSRNYTLREARDGERKAATQAGVRHSSVRPRSVAAQDTYADVRGSVRPKYIDIPPALIGWNEGQRSVPALIS